MVYSLKIERVNDLMLLVLYEGIDQLAMASSVNWHGHVLIMEDGYMLRREDGHVLRMEDSNVLRSLLDFEVEGQGEIGMLERK